MNLTAQQERAIYEDDHGLIVSAAAGSGKTFVLVSRLMRKLTAPNPEQRVQADRIVVVTFTKDAAAEMRSRLYRKLDEEIQNHPDDKWLYEQQIRLQDAQICTIHSFCFHLIREHLSEQGITSSFRVLNETENNLISAKAVDAVLNRWNLQRQKDMTLLWDSFCEKNDKPLEKIIMELHSFLGSVSFREKWAQDVMAELEKPLEESIYHRLFLQQLEQRVEIAAQLAVEAAELAQDICDEVSENKVLAWVEEDARCLNLVRKQLRQGETDTSKILTLILEKRQNRSGRNFPSVRKNKVKDDAAYSQVKNLRAKYESIEKNELIPMLENIIPYEALDFEMHRQLVPLLLELEQELSEEIWKQKVQRNALGFDDAERMVLELLATPMANGEIRPSKLARELQSDYELIMVDEYQDSNNKQDDIFKLLSRNCVDEKTGKLRHGENIFLVGDVKQSIYRFRLANPQNFIHAIVDTKAEYSVCRHIVLNRNFRSVPVVLQFINFVCGCLMSSDCGDVAYTEEEALYAGSELEDILPPEQQKVTVAVLPKADDAKTDMQMQYTIRKIQNMIAEQTPVTDENGLLRPCQYRDFCILMRSKAQCADFAHALEHAGIPVQSPEEAGYLKAREIHVLLDMLRVLDNPTLDTSLAAIMLSPMFLFTPDDLMQIRMLQKNTGLYGTVCIAAGVAESDSPTVVDAALREKCRELYDTIQSLRRAAGMMTLEMLIRHIYDRTDFLSVMQLSKNGARKRANLQLLLHYVRQYEENTDASHGGISGFLRYVDWLLDSNNDFQQTSTSAGIEDAVVIKTMHGSKGLEFPFVFLCGLEHRFSTEDSRKDALFSEKGLVGFCIKEPKTYVRAKTLHFSVIDQMNRNNSDSEELRLLYVAMTRAKQQLFLALTLESEKKLDEYGALILSNGTYPAYAVRSAGSMANWIWMSLILLHDIDLEKHVKLPERHWDTPAWSETLHITYEFDLPESISACDTVAEAVPSKAIVQPDMEIVASLRKIASFTYNSPDCDRESQLRVSALQEEKNHADMLWKRPNFHQRKHRLTGAERGTAIHTFLQYADFEKAEKDFFAEKEYLRQHGFLSPEQSETVELKIIETFFQSDIYHRLCKSKHVLREQKFSVQCRDLPSDSDIAEILQNYVNSDSILKGIIDLAFLEEDGYVLVDYKTDDISSSEELINRYRTQLALYRGALQCITEKPVRQCYLYSTHLQKSIEVKHL